jgi:hypothetical protein
MGEMGRCKKPVDGRMAGQTCIVGMWSLDDPTAAGWLLASDRSVWCQWGSLCLGVKSALIHDVVVRSRIGSRIAGDAVACQEMVLRASALINSNEMNSAYRLLFARRWPEFIRLLPPRRLFAIQNSVDASAVRGGLNPCLSSAHAVCRAFDCLVPIHQYPFPHVLLCLATCFREAILAAWNGFHKHSTNMYKGMCGARPDRDEVTFSWRCSACSCFLTPWR